MLGLILGWGISLLVSATSWRTYRRRYDPRECRLIERCLSVNFTSPSESFVVSRPGRLLAELRGIGQYPELSIATLNDALGEVDSATRSGLPAVKGMARVSFAAGLAGACIELASNVRASALQAVCWSLAAFLGGLSGTITCTVIGRWAMRGFSRRRRLWDEFVQWILNSQFSRSDLNVHGGDRDLQGGD
jgi:hypothetical protein